MNIVIPMAGRGSRLANWQQNIPKPLIRVSGKPMVLWALESLQGLTATRLIFVVLSEHEKQYGIVHMLSNVLPIPSEFVFLDQVTEGQLCTVLAARQWIDTDEDLLIASADTLVRSNLIYDIQYQPIECHGIISVANLPGDHWSFARTDENDRVVEVAEKVRISENASTGIYYFRCGREFVTTGDEIIHNEEKTRGEYYLIPVYQKFIEQNWMVKISRSVEAWDMGNPESIQYFEQKYQKQR